MPLAIRPLARIGNHGVGGGFQLQPLAEPGVRLLPHPAPIGQACRHRLVANAQRTCGRNARPKRFWKRLYFRFSQIADRWGEPTEHLLQNRSWPEAITEKVKDDRLSFASASIILAVDDPCLAIPGGTPPAERFANALCLISFRHQPVIRIPTPPQRGNVRAIQRSKA